MSGERSGVYIQENIAWSLKEKERNLAICDTNGPRRYFAKVKSVR